MVKTASAIALVVVFAFGGIAYGVTARTPLTLKSLDKRVKALTALVLLDERQQENHPPALKTMRVSAAMYFQGAGLYRGSTSCGGGDEWQATGGGVEMSGTTADASTITSKPNDLNGWDAFAYAPANSYAGGPPTVQVYVVCAQVAPAP